MRDSGITPTLPEDIAAAATPRRGASIGRFLVLGPLGAGGTSVVLSAYDPDLDRTVARGAGDGPGVVHRDFKPQNVAALPYPTQDVAEIDEWLAAAVRSQ